ADEDAALEARPADPGGIGRKERLADGDRVLAVESDGAGRDGPRGGHGEHQRDGAANARRAREQDGGGGEPRCAAGEDQRAVAWASEPLLDLKCGEEEGGGHLALGGGAAGGGAGPAHPPT